MSMEELRFNKLNQFLLRHAEENKSKKKKITSLNIGLGLAKFGPEKTASALIDSMAVHTFHYACITEFKFLKVDLSTKC